MAGTICGYAPACAPGGAFYGVAPKVPLIPVRITDSVWITHAQRQFRDAVAHLIGNPGAKVINVSLGVFAGVVVGAMKSAVNDATRQGVIMVRAAGNYVNPGGRAGPTATNDRRSAASRSSRSHGPVAAMGLRLTSVPRRQTCDGRAPRPSALRLCSRRRRNVLRDRHHQRCRSALARPPRHEAR
jgi:subtilisin family serine protease